MKKKMRIFIMTDMEGVAGVVNHDDWVMPNGRYYDVGRSFLTMEVNAAIAGFFAGGADAVDVADGHGAGGIDVSLLDSRASYIRGANGPYPFGMDSSHNGIAWIGQHAKAGSIGAHIAHTGWFDVVDYKINGVSVGEFGTMAFIAHTMGIKPFFGSGDAAFCKEAKTLYQNIYTIQVKEGYQTDPGDSLTTDQYRGHNLGAKHLSPITARKLIRNAAKDAVKNLIRDQKLPPPVIQAPYTLEVTYRNDEPGNHITKISKPCDSLVDLLNNPWPKGETFDL
jgi:D-amino peptidase